MKPFKRFSAFLLALSLALGLSVPALAAVDDTGFSDVDADAWYAEAVMYCREHNLMAGIGNNQFAPESSLTRAQFATVLYRIEGTPAVTGADAFTDTPDGAWYSDAVLWASQQDLISGYGSGLFGPNDPVSREQMTTIFWRYAGSPAADGASDYTDKASIASYAAAAVDWASVNNRGIAQEIQRQTGAELFEIEMVTPYSTDYNTVLDQAQEAQNNQDRPELSTHVEDMSQYDTIILGYPNWWASIPMPVASFLEEYDFTGKTIVPFCSHGGGRFGQSLTAITKLVPDAVLGEGLAVSYSGGSSLSEDVAAWLEENNISVE